MTGQTDDRTKIFIFQCSVAKLTGNYGIVTDVKLTLTPSIAGRDYLGRPTVNGYFAVAEWALMQNGQDSLNVIADDLNAGTAEYVQITGMPSAANSGYIQLGDMKPVYTVDFDGDGNLSVIKARAERIFTLSEFIALFNTGGGGA